MEKKNITGVTVTLVDPVAYYREEFPEDFDLLPRGEEDLAPELALIVRLSREYGLPVHIDESTGQTYVHSVICEGVFGGTILPRQEDREASPSNEHFAVASVGEAAIM